jgi:GntR family transcriptional regulator, rspAB operon transcriptional repressor
MCKLLGTSVLVSHSHEVGARSRSLRSIMASIPLAQAAYEKLRNMILSGELPPKSAITENAIVDRLAIGKTPVREGMRRLVLEGLLDVTPRLGYTVSDITRRDVDDLFQLRAIVEVAAAELAADNLDAAALNRMTELSTITYTVGDGESIMAFVGANAEFHDIISRASGNARLTDLIARLMLECGRFLRLTDLTDAHAQLVIEQHVAIVAAFRSRDRGAIAEEVRRHVYAGRDLAYSRLAPAAMAG